MARMLRSPSSSLQRVQRTAALLFTLAAFGCASQPAPEPGLGGARRSSPQGAEVGIHFWMPDGPAARVLSLQVPEGDDAEPAEPERGARASSGKRAPEPEGERRYVLLNGITLAPAVEQKVAAIADAYFRRTGKELVVTSGTRDPARQAEAMLDLFRHGADVLGLYRDKAAVREILTAYEAGRAAGLSSEAMVAAIEHVIRAQVERGVFISAHLREGAVDIRNRDMTSAEKRAFLDGVEEVGGVLALEETRPPHFHLQIDD